MTKEKRGQSIQLCRADARLPCHRANGASYQFLVRSS